MGTVPRVRAGRAGRGHLELGRAGERAAAELLRERGYEVVGAGFAARRGELDLVCRKGGELVVVEVKTRSSAVFGAPADAVTARKRRALMSAAAEYRALAGWRGPIRFAVIGLTVDPEGGFEAELIEDPFD
ncbi:MAG TPA: YraN family protein [Candidatus Dormibacteraeota bacterium]|nr:YraN family protein [Candidatus Dormibacteraeota bacterium]